MKEIFQVFAFQLQDTQVVSLKNNNFVCFFLGGPKFTGLNFCEC